MIPSELQEAGVAEGPDRMVTEGHHATGPDLNGNGTDPVHMQDDALQGRELVAVLEALLFVSGEPLPLARLTTVIGAVSKAEVEQAPAACDVAADRGVHEAREQRHAADAKDRGFRVCP